MYPTASWTNTASKTRPRRIVRMSPGTCSHSGLISRLSASIGSELSVSVHRKRFLRYSALCPAPEPSSSNVSGAGVAAPASASAYTSASSA